jgi:hypothetical protein
VSRYDAARVAAPLIMPRLVDRSTGLVRFSSFAALDKELRSLGFSFLRKLEYGPPGGFQIFYSKDLNQSAFLVRIKTKGEVKGRPRAETPHMSVAITDEAGELWQNERGKITASGKIEAKTMLWPKTDANPRGFEAGSKDFQNNPHRFAVILGGAYDGAGPDAWADRVHFAFPTGTDFGTAEALSPR